MKKLITLSLLVVLCSNFSLSQTRAERKLAKKERLESEYNSIKALIESGKFQFEANWAIPLGNDVANIGLNFPGGSAIFQGGRVDISNNDNSVNIEGKDAHLFLPYFGRVFFPSRNPDENGIQFKGEITNYKVKFNDKKHSINIKFEAKSDNDYLKFIYKINSDGSTLLNVNSANRQSISYSGTIQVLQESVKLN